MTIDRFTVEASHIMMFARSINDYNPIYMDPDHAATTEVGHVIAPPTFAQASAQFDPDYFLRPQPGKTWFGSAKSASGLMDEPQEEKKGGGGGGGGGLHAEQHFVYHRHLQPGDVLTATTMPGKSWEKEGKRGGSLKFSESVTEYRDQNGELVITATGLGVQTSKPAEG